MRRLLHLLFGLLALACFAGSVFAIDWIWTVKKPAIDKTTNAFNQADQWLDLADRAVDEVKVSLESSRTLYSLPQTAAVGEMAAGPGSMNNMIARMLVKKITPNVNSVQITLDRVTEASIVVNSILDTLHDMDIPSIDRLDVDQVRNLQRQLDGVTKASGELSDLLDTGNGESPAAQSARIAASLENIIGMTKDFQQRVQALRKRAQQYREKTLYWLNNGPTLATIVLCWVAISQVVVLIVVVKSFRKIGD